MATKHQFPDCIEAFDDGSYEPSAPASMSERFWHRQGREVFGKRKVRGEAVCTELKTPYVMDGHFVVKRRLPDGVVVARFGPFESPAAAERFVVERMRQGEMKPYQIGDSEHDDDA